MSPSVFRPLLDRSTSGKRSGPVPAWEPDPLLSGAAVGQGRPDERAAASGVRATETFEQLDMPISGPEDVPEPGPREASARHCGHGAASRFAAAEGPAFEPLSMECLTGVPRSETVESAFGDGLEFELDPLPEPGRSDDESGIDIDEFGDLEVDPESGSGARIVPDDSVDTANPLTETSEVDDRPDGEPSVPGPVAAAVLNVDIEEPEAFVGPPIPMIRESEHLEEIEAVRKTTREAAWAEAHQKGLDEGISRTRRTLEAEFAKEREAMHALVESIRTAVLDPIALHAPLRRLAVHLAMELVRGELSHSSDAIGRLIGTCLAEIDRAPGDHLVLSLHPDDLERWIAQPAISLDRVELRADPGIGPGSVRLSAGDTVIEDLLDHRLASIATRVLGEGGAQRLPRLGSLRARGFAEGDISDVG